MSRYREDAIRRAKAKAKPSPNGRQVASDPWPESMRGDAWEPPPEQEPPPAADPASMFAFRWEPVDSASFGINDYRPNWLCRGVQVANQPAILGGPSKAMKTTIAIDLAVSYAAGLDFLGRFPCPVRKRVAFLSGESGPFTIQETARRVCAAKGIELPDLGDYLRWQFTLPQLSRLDQLETLRAGIERDGIEVLFIDPLYLSLLSGGDGQVRAENLYEIGPLLLRVSQACLSAGATPNFLHHTRKGAGREGQPLDLTDLAFSGVAEFARQWLLLSRREPFAPGTGRHKLWIVVGGSVGHGGQYAVDVDEGQLGDDFTGRRWDVTVETPTAARATVAADKETAKRREQATKDRADDDAVMAALDRLDPAGTGCGVRTIRTETGFSHERLERVLARLRRDGLIEECTVKVATGKGAERDAKAIRRTPDNE